MRQQLPDKPHDGAATAPKQRIPKRVRHACNLLINGECKTVKAAAERAGLTREHLSRTLRQPHVRAYLEREARETIADLKVRATSVLEMLLDAGSEHVRFEAAKHVLALNGIRPPEREGVQVNVNVTPGYVIDLTEPNGDRTLALDGTAVQAPDALPAPSDPPDVVAE